MTFHYHVIDKSTGHFVARTRGAYGFVYYLTDNLQYSLAFTTPKQAMAHMDGVDLQGSFLPVNYVEARHILDLKKSGNEIREEWL